MHKYLRAIGFSKIQKDELEELLDNAITVPDYMESAIDGDGSQFVELRFMVADNIGIVMRGSYNRDDEFELDYYYPSSFSDIVSTNGDIDVIQQSDKQNYYVMCDEIRLGVNLIFQLQNTTDFLKKRLLDINEDRDVKLAALSTEGKILLPIYSTDKSKEKVKKRQEQRNDLIEAAKSGNEQAMENLTLQEIDTYSKISRRISNQDILTVVTTYFMPYGIENDKYEILGNILDVRELFNYVTMEELYQMKIEANDVIFEVCINKKDLFGEPIVGRRFKGSIWLQGTVDF